MGLQNIPINVSFTGTSSFIPQAIAQRTYILDATNPSYQRNAQLTQDSLYLTFFTTSVVIPLVNLYQCAASASSVLAWPPVINTQPFGYPVSTGSIASASIYATSFQPGQTYQWYSQSYSQSLASSSFVPLTNGSVYSGVTSATMSYSASQAGMSSSYNCIVSNTSGNTTSSNFTWFITN